MIGIVVPAHNEEACIGACLDALREAARHPGLAGETVEIVVVLDACTDATGVLANAAAAMTLSVRARNVGMARAVGAQVLLVRGARWLAFTDADTVVSPSWLVDQLSLRADVVCGTVGVADWTPHGGNAPLLARHFQQTYTDGDGHSHVHGANLGVCAAAYERAGGFRHLECSEDVALVNALVASGASVAWSAKPRVVTSARKEARAVGGFADALIQAVARQLDVAVQPVHSAAPVSLTT
ncbi:MULTISPECIES: glycosyltransferase [unclassified Variovorax]|uniref:glycosyltransferase n=1 Tax=unclassified Variovorax TaxID=663243 RepID=UPI003F4730FA